MLSSIVAATPFVACDDDDDEPTIVRNYDEEETETPHLDAPDFAYGYDPSWITAMEDGGIEFKDASGTTGDLFTIMNGIGANACRLRAWVNPTDGYCNTSDVVLKAQRAYALGQAIMIDFHYSDEWADPATQRKPSIWDGCETIDDLADKVYSYTKKTLNSLLINGVDVAWVQIGNETNPGMMTTNSDGSSTDVAGTIGANYVTLHKAAAEAIEEVYPEAKTILHLANIQKQSTMEYVIQRLVNAGIEFDILGVSLYPDVTEDDWYATYIDGAITNLNYFAEKYDCETMIAEIGISDIETDDAKTAIVDAYQRARDEVESCLGVFYWEPENYTGWNGYWKGAFTTSGSPSETLIEAFAH